MPGLKLHFFICVDKLEFYDNITFGASESILISVQTVHIEIYLCVHVCVFIYIRSDGALESVVDPLNDMSF